MQSEDTVIEVSKLEKKDDWRVKMYPHIERECVAAGFTSDDFQLLKSKLMQKTEQSESLEKIMGWNIVDYLKELKTVTSQGEVNLSRMLFDALILNLSCPIGHVPVFVVKTKDMVDFVCFEMNYYSVRFSDSLLTRVVVKHQAEDLINFTLPKVKYVMGIHAIKLEKVGKVIFTIGNWRKAVLINMPNEWIQITPEIELFDPYINALMTVTIEDPQQVVQVMYVSRMGNAQMAHWDVIMNQGGVEYEKHGFQPSAYTDL